MTDDKNRGARATSDAFRKYDQVHKPQAYRLADEGGEDAYDDDFVVRTCDLGRWLNGGPSDRKRFAAELAGSLEEIGFAVLENHGLAPDVHGRAFERVERFFTSVPLEEKLRFRARRQGSVSQGYFPLRETSDIHADLVEGWVFCRRAFDLGEREGYRTEEFWPRPQDEPFFGDLVRANETLILPVMQAMLTGLGCDPHAFDARLTRTNIGLRLNHYPPVPAGERDTGAGRLLGHEDVGMFTLLPAPRAEGLQVLNRANGKWVRLTPPPGTIILNTGDYVQRITNDRFPSTTHRVARPRGTALLDRPRVSFPMNVYVWENEVLEVLPGLGEPKYPPVKAITFHTASTSKFYGDDYAVSE